MGCTAANPPNPPGRAMATCPTPPAKPPCPMPPCPMPPPRMADALDVEPAVTIAAAANAIAILRIMVSSIRYAPDTGPEPKPLMVDPTKQTLDPLFARPPKCCFIDNNTMEPQY